MSNRLTKIVTRGGDKGETSLGDGTRIAKDDPRIALLGDVDELNSWVGVLRAKLASPEILETLERVQHDLFDLGGALCFPGAPILSAGHVARIDEAAAALNEGLPPLKEFILPGGSEALSFTHIARTVCRSVERAMVAFARSDENVAPAVQYLNRLSDYFFIAARFEATSQGIAEIYWRKENSLGAE